MRSNNNKISNCQIFLMWLSLAIFFIYQFIARSSFPSVLTEQFMEYFHIDAVGVGTLASCYYIVYTFAQVPSGILSDRFSPKIIGSLMTMICASGVGLFVATQNSFIAGIGQALVGFGSSFAFLLLLKTINTWMPANKIAIITSVTVSIGCLGPVVGGPVVANLVENMYWRNLMIAFAIFGLLIATFIFFTVKDKKSSEPTAAKISLIDTFKLILSSKQAWLLFILSMLLYAPLSAVADLWGVKFIKTVYGVDSKEASMASNMIYLGLIVGGPICASFTNIFNSFKKPMLLFSIIAAIAFGVFLFLDIGINGAFVTLFITGFSCSAVNLPFSLAAFKFESKIQATVSSFINTGAMLSGVILMPLIGKLIDYSSNGCIENGVPIYTASDVKFGFLPIFIFLIASVIVCSLIDDAKPNSNAK